MNLNIKSTVVLDGENAVITTTVPAAKLGQLQKIVGDTSAVSDFAASLVEGAAQALIAGAIANGRVTAANEREAAIVAAVTAADAERA